MGRNGILGRENSRKMTQRKESLGYVQGISVWVKLEHRLYGVGRVG